MHFTHTLKAWRRQVYSLRAFVPGWRRRHELESLVGPLGFWDQLQNYQLQAVVQLGLRPRHSLLDIGCGPLQGGIAFIRYLHADCYLGVDHNPSAIEIGQEEVTRHNLWSKRPRILVSPAFGDNHLGDSQFDFIWLSQILYYFDEPTFQRLFSMARRRLRPAGVMAGDILGPASDHSFLRDPKPPVHTPESLDSLARPYGFRAAGLGELSEFGYPKRLGLRRNILIKITDS